MLHRSFKPAKCKTSLKLATSRLKLMRNKKDNHLKQLKRELAQLLESGQDQTALIRVEHVVREEKTIAAYELIDIYCELIVARLPIIDSQKNCPIDLKEAVTSVVFATPRCSDIPELQDVRKHFTAKYGKEFVNAALELRPDCGVSRMLVEKLSANAPDGQTKLKILTAIAEEHNVEWDPKSFGEKESKPYDDLLKGPNTFDSASKMQSEPPIVQAYPPPPPPDFDAPHDQEYDPREHFQQNLHSSNFSGAQSAPSTAPHPPVRSSGAGYEETEIRHSHSGDQNAFSQGGQSWNMEFKDATAAAQAAAESAERASMAARAAAELASRGKFMSQQSDASRKSNGDGMIADGPRKNHDSSSENFFNDVDFNSPQDGNRKLSMRTEQVDEYVHERHFNADERFEKDDHGTAERYSQAASSRSGTASSFVDDRRPVNNYHEVDRYSRNSPFVEEAAELENNTPVSGSRVRKQSNEEDCNSYSYSNYSENRDDQKKSSSHQNFVFNDSKDSFDNGKSSLGSVNTRTSGAVFDSYLSDDDIIKFDKQPKYDEHESGFYSASSIREPSNNFAVHIDKGDSREKTSSLSENPLSASRVSADLFSVPRFDETSPKAPSSEYLNDLAPPIFDDCPISDIEDELEKSSFRGKPVAGISSHKENDLFRKSNYLNEDHDLKGSYFTEKNDSGSSRKQSLLDSSKDRECSEVTGQNKHKDELSSQSRPRFDNYEVPSPRSSSANQNSKVSSNEMARGLPPPSSNSSVNEVFDQSGPESEEELKFPTLTGGLRNKGYKTPPYRKSPSGDSSTLKRATEDSSTDTRNNDLGKDDFEGELPRQNLRSKRDVMNENSSSRTGPKKYNLGMDDSEEELPKPKLANKQERKEDYTKSKFSAPVGYFGPDSDDSEEDVPKHTVTSTGRAGSGFSRRTKANPDSETNSHSKAKHGSAGVKSTSVPENKPDVASRRSTTPRPDPEENQKPSSAEQLSNPLKATTSSGMETLRTSSGEAPSRESSFKKVNHVHPKLPDYDSIAAHLQSFRPNRD